MSPLTRTCIVICRGDRVDEQAPYELATRTVFESEEAAAAYMRTISPSREPLAVPLTVSELRVGEPRGTLAYWEKWAP